MVVARNARAHHLLSQQFKGRTVRKEYIALVYGKVATAVGKVDAPVGRSQKDRKKISVHAPKHRPAVTRYQVAAFFNYCTRLRVRPETGRTHQIRVHLSSIGHPVVGDRLYGGHRNLPKYLQNEVSRLDRFFLHAHTLEFLHPQSLARMSFSAPLPPELASFLDRIRGYAAN
jgi:23S rRNA pseudouridine1911/1915/1917 synthase